MRYAAIISATFLAFLLTGTAAAQSSDDDPIAAYERRIEQQQRELDEIRRELEAVKKTVGSATSEQAVGSERRVEAQSSLPPTVGTRNEKLTVTLSGRVLRMLLAVDDGANSDVFFTDSEQGPTMLSVAAEGTVSDTLSVGAKLETGIRQNRPFLVSQDEPQSGTSVNVRIAEVYFHSSRLGRLSLGQGFASAWLAPEIDLSGTQYAALLPVGMLAPGMKFVNAADNSLSNIQVLNHFVDVERLLLVDRVRYDSASFGPGLQVSSSIGNDGRWDAALRAKPKSAGGWTLVGGAAYLHQPFSGTDYRYDAGISVRHNSTGLNLTGGAARERLTSGRYSNTYVIKAGWLADLVSLGKTAFSVDYYSVSDLRLAGDDGKSYGIFGVQKWSEYGLETFAGYRRYEVDRPDIDLKNLDVYAFGVAFTF